MAQPKVLVLRAPGTNCDAETAYAFDLAGGKSDVAHLNRLLENPKLLTSYAVVCLPGGFSYGDDVAAGKIFGNQIALRLGEAFHEHRERGGLVLGICNGFQVLIRSGLLLEGGADGAPAATLDWNDHGRYEDRWVYLRPVGSRCVFLQGIERLYLPVAHDEGKFVPLDERAFAALEQAGQLALRYTSANGADAEQDLLGFPANPNGSTGNVAGVCDVTGRVFGLMPHPERHLHGVHHPQWTRHDSVPEYGDGFAIFRNAVKYAS